MKSRMHRPATMHSPARANGSPAIAVAVRQILHAPHPQAKLSMSVPGDATEREADRVADDVMRTPDTGVQRMCSACEEELQAKEEPGRALSVPDDFDARFAALRGSGAPLPAADRAFFEPRFGRDFSNVRLHSGGAAGDLARSIHARAFTLGDAIVVGAGEYAPGTSAGRELLAHELTHVVQQGHAAEPRVVRRQTIHSSCSRQADLIRAAWAEGQRLASATRQSLENLQTIISSGVEVSPRMSSLIQNTFGDVGLTPGFTHLNDLIGRYAQIEAGFTAGRTLRCDPRPDAVGNECNTFDAYVVPGNRTDIFLCASFFDSAKTPTGRGAALLHEMAHSALGIAHQGGTFGQFGCESSLGLEYDDARRNAYPYAVLANCLHGEGASEAEPVTGNLPAARDRRFSLSGAAGVELGPAAQRFAGVLGGRVSLRTGQFVVFNPIIGANLLYLPSGARPEHLAAVTVDLGLRIQQPLRGVYFDVTGGGLEGFTVDAAGRMRNTGGLTGTAGLGYRFERFELGAEARGLLPLTAGDSASLIILGRVAVRLP